MCVSSPASCHLYHRIFPDPAGISAGEPEKELHVEGTEPSKTEKSEKLLMTEKWRPERLSLLAMANEIKYTNS